MIKENLAENNNVDQKQFVDILHKVTVAETYSEEPRKIDEVLNEMIDYAWDHFRTEEAHMQEFKCPEYVNHKEEHLGFILKTLSYFKRRTSGDYPILNEIQEYLRRWQINHIQGGDRKYIECILKNGLK